jgi:hypothetical protein
MTEPTEQGPKIIVDEDWKSQVQAEKEQLAGQPPPGESPQAPGEEFPIPEASFSVLVTTLGSQAMVALGQVPAPEQETVPVHLDFAKHCIDLLGILEEKTAGNLTADESRLLGQFLYELRMVYVAVQKEVQKNVRGSSIVTPDS